MEFYRIFLIEYSLFGIVKPKFTRRNDYLGKKIHYNRPQLLFKDINIIFNCINVTNNC